MTTAISDFAEDALIYFLLFCLSHRRSRGASRSTFDLDLLVVERRVLRDDFWERARGAGADIEIRTSDLTIRWLDSCASDGYKRFTQAGLAVVE